MTPWTPTIIIYVLGAWMTYLVVIQADTGEIVMSPWQERTYTALVTTFWPLFAVYLGWTMTTVEAPEEVDR